LCFPPSTVHGPGLRTSLRPVLPAVPSVCRADGPLVEHDRLSGLIVGRLAPAREKGRRVFGPPACVGQFCERQAAPGLAVRSLAPRSAPALASSSQDFNAESQDFNAERGVASAQRPPGRYGCCRSMIGTGLTLYMQLTLIGPSLACGPRRVASITVGGASIAGPHVSSSRVPLAVVRWVSVACGP